MQFNRTKGRPPLYDSEMALLSIRIPQHQLEWLKSHQERGSISELVREAVEDKIRSYGGD